MLLLVVAHHKGAADIGFPLIEHRTEIKKTVSSGAISRTGGFSAKTHTVLGPARTIRLCQCLRTPNDTLSERVDILIDLGLGPARTNEALRSDGGEERLGLGLRLRAVQQDGHAETRCGLFRRQRLSRR